VLPPLQPGGPGPEDQIIEHFLRHNDLLGLGTDHMIGAEPAPEISEKPQK
jgi:hypothetical protein